MNPRLESEDLKKVAILINNEDICHDIVGMHYDGNFGNVKFQVSNEQAAAVIYGECFAVTLIINKDDYLNMPDFKTFQENLQEKKLQREAEKTPPPGPINL